jgi:hypothetical protein
MGNLHIGLAFALNLPGAVQNGRVVPVAKVTADFRQRPGGVATREAQRYLPRVNNILGPPTALDLSRGNIEMPTDSPDNLINEKVGRRRAILNREPDWLRVQFELDRFRLNATLRPLMRSSRALRAACSSSTNDISLPLFTMPARV